MVAIVTGAGVGLQRDSAAALGAQGQLGTALLGQAGNRVTVNAANGNLVIQSQDEMLIGTGLDDIITNTYNSQGTFTANGWQESFQRHVSGLTGTVNMAGSTITHFTADGTAVVYTYNTSTGKYVGNEDGGAYDTLSFASNQWTWQDGKTRTYEVYDNANSGRLIQSTDASGNSLSYFYTGSQLSKIATASAGNNDYTTFSYTGSLLTSVVTTYTSGASQLTETRVRYGYDGSNRLTTVTVDLSPNDNSVSDGKTYVTTYGYDGTSNRVASITQSDGTSLTITYTQVGSAYAVASYTRTQSSGVTETTTFSYAANRTTVADPQGNATTFVYDAKGQLTQLVSPPATPGAGLQIQAFSYDANGNVIYSGPAGDPNFTNPGLNWANLATTNGSVSTSQSIEVDGGTPVYRRQTSSTPASGWAMRVEQTAAGLTAVSPGQTVQLSVYSATSGTSDVGLWAEWFDSNGAWLGDTLASSITPGGVLGSSGVATANFASGSAVAIAGAAYVAVVVQAIANGSAPMSIAFAKPVVAVAAPAQDANFLYYNNTNGGSANSWNNLSTTDSTIVPTRSTELDGGVSVYRRQTSTTPPSGWWLNVGQSAGQLTPVSPGQTVSVSAYTATSGAGSLKLWIDWYNATGGWISSSMVSNLTPGGTFGTSGVATANFGSGSAAAVAGAAYAGVTVQGAANGTGPLNVAIARPTVFVAGRESTSSIPTWNYSYDANGNLLTKTDTQGNQTTFTYDGNNQVLTKTEAANSSAPETTRYVYDANSRLVYTISARGVVVKYVYNSKGQQTSILEYDTLYTASGNPTSATMDGWSAPSNIDLTLVRRTDTTYDARGQVATVTTYKRTDSNGNGISSTAATTTYVYDQAGLLLSRVLSDSTAQETFAYDGLGRVLSSTDFNGKTTTTVYNNIATGLQTVTTLANGTTRTSTYDLMGDLITAAESGGGLTSSIPNTFDANGNLTTTRDATGLFSFFVYDDQGRKTADVSADGTITAYAYNAAGQVVSTTEYANRMTATPIHYLLMIKNGTNLPATLATIVASVGTSASDRTSWNVYDTGGRLAESIDATGAVTTYSYDALNRLTSKTTYANLLPASTLAGFQASAPTSVILPAASAGNDRTTRYFYNADDQLVGTLDADGYLTQVFYDASGVKVQTTAYATQTSSAHWTSGTFAQLLADVGSSANDVKHWWVYDNRGLLRADIDSLGNSTRYDLYTANGDVGTITTGRPIDVSSFSSSGPPTLAVFQALLASAPGVDEVTTFTRDQYGRVQSQSLALASGTNLTTTTTYDSVYNPISVTDPNGKVTREVYDGLGRLAYDIDATGAVTGFTYDNAGRTLQTVAYAAAFTTAGTQTQAQMNSWVTANANATNDLATRSVYDADGRLGYTIDATGAVTAYTYDIAGAVILTVHYAALFTTAGTQTLAQMQTWVTTNANATRDLTMRAVYDLDGRVAFSLDATGLVTAYTYDAFGHVVQTVEYATLDGATGVQTLAQMQSWVSSNANAAVDRVTQAAYDAAGRLIYSVDAAGYVTSYTYDGDGRVVQTVRYSLPYGDAAYTGVRNLYQTVVGREPDSNGWWVFGSQVDSGAMTLALVAQTFVTGAEYQGDLNAFSDGTTGNQKVVDFFYHAAFNTTPDATGQSYVTALNNGTMTVAQVALAIAQSPQMQVQQLRTLAQLYNGSLPPVTALPAGSQVTQMAYDAAGRLIYSVDAAGYVTAYTYDADGRVTSTVRYPTPYGGTGYTAVRNLYQTGMGRQPDPSGWAAFGPPVQNGSMTPLALAQTIAGSSEFQGHLSGFSDTATGNQKIVDYLYSAAFGHAPDANGAGYVTALNNGTKTVADVILALSQTAELEIRQLGFLASCYQSVLPSVSSPPAGAQVTRTTYDADGRAAFTIDPNGAVTAFTYDAFGHVVQTIDYATLDTATGVQTLSAMQSWVSSNANAALDRVTQAAYDADGRLIYSVDAAGYVTAYAYDADGRVTSTVRYPTPYGGTGYTAVRNLYQTGMGRQPDPSGWAAFGPPVQNGSMTPLALAQTIAGSSEFQGHLSGFSDTATGNQKIVDYLYSAAFGHAPDANGAGYVTALNNGTKTVADVILALSQTAELEIRQLGFLASCFQSVLPSVSSPPTGTQVTSATYDSDGRLLTSTDTLGIVTSNTYDTFGRLTSTTVAYGTSDAATTTFSYDKDGRVLSQTSASGTAEAVTVSFTYDAFGRKLTAVNGKGGTTTWTYDNDGRVLTVKDAANAITTNQYDAFGDLVKVTDPDGNAGYFYYDATGQRTWAIDAQGYATQTTYDAFGGVLSVRRYFTPVTVTGVTATPPTVTGTASDNLTSFTRDSVGQVLTSTDGNGYVTSYTYDAFGDKVSMTNVLGATLTYAYDARGLLLNQTTPASSVSGLAPVTNTAYQYDAFGNRIKMIEAQGRAEQRTTTYVYDNDNRLSQQIGDAVTVTAAPTGANSTVTPTQSFVYDNRGNQIKATDAAGAVTYTYYDHLDRKVTQVDALNHLTAWTYDKNSNVLSQTRYATTVAGTPPTGGTAPTVSTSGSDRTTTYGYDADNRQTASAIQNVETGKWTGSAWTSTTGTLTTATAVYDADGNTLKSTDANGNATYAYYDKLGRRIAQVDAGGYLTTYTLDAEGNVTSQTQYVTAVSGTPPTGGTPPTVTANANDRTTTFTYDHDGQRLTETRTNVNAATVSGDSVSTASVSATVTYVYNGLGQVTLKTEATGDATAYSYDTLGHLERVTTANLTSQAMATEYTYDGLGNVLTSIAGYGNAVYETTTNTYGAGGRLLSTTDATGFTIGYGYDADGRTTYQGYTRVKSDGSSVQETMFTTYDALGEATSITKATWNGSQWIAAATTDSYYNAFGEVIASGTNTGGAVAKAQTFTDYDNAGRAWRTNSGDGVTKVYGYDGNGNQTIQVQSQGVTDLRNVSSLDGALSSSGITRIYSLYDARNELTDVKRPVSTNLDGTDGSGGNAVIDTSGQVIVNSTVSGGPWGGNTTATFAVTINSPEVSADNGTGLIHVRIYSDHPSLVPDQTFNYASGTVNCGTYTYNIPNGPQPTGPGYQPTVVNITIQVSQDNGSGGTIQLMAPNGTTVVAQPSTPVIVPHAVSFGTSLKVNVPNATGIVAYVRPAGSTGTYTQVSTAQVYDLSNNAVAGARFVDLTKPPFNATANTSWDVVYVATNGSGQVVDAKEGTVSFDGNGHPTATSFASVNTFVASQNGDGTWSLNANALAIAYSDTSQTFNAFGDVLSQTDANNNTTNYSYDALGDLTVKTAPSVASVDEHGNQTTVNPTDTWYYDKSGRLVGHRDANNYLTTQVLLAGTGYGGTQALTTTQYNPDGNVVSTGYDIFGNVLTQADALGTFATNTYDRDNRLLTVAHAARGSGDTAYTASGTPSQLIDTYVYDGLGQRIKHTNNVFGTGVVETTDYDVLGRVTRSVSFGGQVTSYGYSWNAMTATGRVTAGQSGVGAWTTTTTNVAGLSASSTKDYFGAIDSNSDFGGHSYSYSYNLAGQLSHQSSSAGQSLDYVYTSSGQVAKVTDNATGIVEVFAYDKAGNRTIEGYYRTGSTPGDYQNSVITYDALNRVTEIHDANADITYRYDANGNRREVRSVYVNINRLGSTTYVASGPSGSTQIQDYWYKYDSMNRFVMTKGILSGNAIVVGATGTAITYDVRGDRMTATYGSDNHVETYAYSADGYLETVKITPNGGAQVLQAMRVTDVLGRDTAYTEYQTNGSSVLLTRAMTYDRDNRVTAETDQTYNGSTTYTSQITNDYKANVNGSYTGADQGVITHSQNLQTQTGSSNTVTTTTVYAYAWWNQAKSNTTTVTGSDPSNPNSNQWAAGNATYSYDQNGNMTQVNDTGVGRVVTYQDDSFGQVLARRETDNGTAGIYRNFFYLNGQTIGDVGTDQLTSQIDYNQQMATDRSNAASAGQAIYQINATPYVGLNANFDENYQADNATSVGNAGGSYSVMAGDTLQSIAQNVWGDSSLWYVLAQANGLSAGANLVAGQSLIIPDGVTNLHNATGISKPYNASDALSNTTPTLPQEPQPPAPSASSSKHGGCGVVGDIIAIVVAAVVTYATFGATLSALGPIGAGAASFAAGDAVFQGTELLDGNQSKFNWTELAASAVAGGISGGLGLLKDTVGPLSNIGKGIGKAVFNATALSTVRQGVNMAFGLQKTFDWTGLAASAVAGVVGYEVGSRVGGMPGVALRGAAAGLASAATRGLLTGQDLGKSIREALPDIIGSTIGDMITEGLTPKHSETDVSQAQMTDQSRSALLDQADLTDQQRAELQKLPGANIVVGNKPLYESDGTTPVNAQYDGKNIVVDPNLWASASSDSAAAATLYGAVLEEQAGAFAERIGYDFKVGGTTWDTGAVFGGLALSSTIDDLANTRTDNFSFAVNGSTFSTDYSHLVDDLDFHFTLDRLEANAHDGGISYQGAATAALPPWEIIRIAGNSGAATAASTSITASGARSVGFSLSAIANMFAANKVAHDISDAAEAKAQAVMDYYGLDANSSVDKNAADAYVTQYGFADKYHPVGNVYAAEAAMWYVQAHPSSFGSGLSWLGQSAADKAAIGAVEQDAVAYGVNERRISAVDPALSTYSLRARGILIAANQTRGLQNWQAHHLVPFAEVANLPVAVQRNLAASGWRVDSLVNLLAVPGDYNTYVSAPNNRQIPYHSGPHPKYSADVAKLLTSIGATLTPAQTKLAVEGVDSTFRNTLLSNPLVYHPRIN
jgi:YD repeat-containing protein